jgi:hypothetical protein
MNNEVKNEKNIQLVEIMIEPYLPINLPNKPANNAPTIGKNITNKYIIYPLIVLI